MRRLVRALGDRYVALPAGLRAVPPLVWMALLWWASSQPPRETGLPPATSVLQNSAHVVAFGALGLLLWLWLHGDGRRRTVAAIALACLYAVVDETHQAFVPGRDASVADWCSDAFGAALASCGLGWRLQGDARARALLPWLLVGAAGSVSAATWLGW